MRTLYAWVDAHDEGLVLVFPKETDTRLKQLTRLMSVAHLSAAALAMNFKDADPEASPEFRAIGQAADALARSILAFQDRAREELAKTPVVPDGVFQ